MARTSPNSVRPIAILVAGEPIQETLEKRGSFAHLIRAGIGDAWPGSYSEADLRTGAALPQPADVAGVIVTGSAASVVDREAWTLAGEAYLARLVDAGLPVLGICYGHQMLATALGGKVAPNPNGREIGSLEFDICARDDLLEWTGAGPRRANFTHVDSVVELPAGAQRIAHTRLDPNAAIRFAPMAWGVQFHPEIDAEVMHHYVSGRRDILTAEGFDPEAITREIEDAPAGAAVLRRFAEILAWE